MRDWLDIATIQKKKNLKGRLVVRMSHGLPFFLEPGTVLHAVPPKTDVPRVLTIESVSEIRGDTAEVCFAEVSDANTAEQLIGCHCLVRKQDVESLREFTYETDNVSETFAKYAGWVLEDEQLGRIGTIVEVMPSPAQPLLVVDATDRSASSNVLVPLAEQLIVNEQSAQRVLKMDLPQGILEL